MKLGLNKKDKKESFIQTGYHVLSTKPAIIVTVWNLRNQGINEIFNRYLKYKKVYFIFLLWWSTESKSIVSKIRDVVEKEKKYYPEHEFIFLCNTQKEYRLFQKFNLPCIFCNHNALIDEKIFSIMPREKRRYDAIYNAQMAWFKRHQLASKIDNLALITVFDGINTSSLYSYIIKKVLSNASLLNKPSSSSYGKNNYLDPVEIARYLNQAKVGLCLSAKEGAMYASTEYLLCGLPLISTRSKGGRDIFFDKKYVKIVDDNKVAVKEGVEELIKRDIDSNYIRINTLEKMNPHRERFITLIQEIYDKEGANKKFRDEWNKIFVNKMLLWQDINLIKNYIEK